MSRGLYSTTTGHVKSQIFQNNPRDSFGTLWTHTTYTHTIFDIPDTVEPSKHKSGVSLTRYLLKGQNEA